MNSSKIDRPVRLACWQQRRILSLLVAFLLTYCVVHGNGWAGEKAAASPPDILLIMADDVGCDALGCYGGTSYPTPNLDQLARTGMRFRHCYSMPVCHPTRICLLTGRYPFRLSNPAWGTFPKTEENNTIGHVMKRAGYATAIAGKWQLTMLGREPDHPHRLGFDEYCLFGWHEGPRYYQPLIWQNGEIRRDVVDRYGPDVYCDYLIDFITRNRDRPFFAFYSMALCHDVTDDLAEPVPFGPHGHYDTYAEMMEAMDREVGRLIAVLDDLNLRKRTLILFTTDNGTPGRYIHSSREGRYIRKPIVMKKGGETIRGGKGQLTDAGTRVPLIANWQGTVPAGQTADDLVDFSDFLPTIAEIGGAPLPPGRTIDGLSFADRLRQRAASPRRWAYAEHQGRRWVRTQRWKLYDDGRLFDMIRDSQERQIVDAPNESADAANARKTLQQALDGLRVPPP